MSHLHQVLEYNLNHLFKLPEFKFEVEDLWVMVSPELQKEYENKEDELVYEVFENFYANADDINKNYSSYGHRSTEIKYGKLGSVFVNSIIKPKENIEWFDVDLNKFKWDDVPLPKVPEGLKTDKKDYANEVVDKMLKLYKEYTINNYPKVTYHVESSLLDKLDEDIEKHIGNDAVKEVNDIYNTSIVDAQKLANKIFEEGLKNNKDYLIKRGRA